MRLIEQRLEIIADIAETVPKDRLNDDVAYGIAYTIGYLGGALESYGDDS